jgi:hypothetical protein
MVWRQRPDSGRGPDLPSHGTISTTLRCRSIAASPSTGRLSRAMKTGVSIFGPDAGGDTGPVLQRARAETPQAVSTTSLPQGIEMIWNRWLVERERRSLLQDQSRTYEKPAEDPLLRIDWRKPVPRVTTSSAARPSPAPGPGWKGRAVTDARPHRKCGRSRRHRPNQRRRFAGVPAAIRRAARGERTAGLAQEFARARA